MNDKYLLRIFAAIVLLSLALYAQTVVNGSRKFTGSVETGFNSGKTGYSIWYGKTDGGLSGFAVNDTAGGPILYLLPTTAGTTGQVMQIGAAVTCPTLPVDAPTVTCYPLSWIAH